MNKLIDIIYKIADYFTEDKLLAICGFIAFMFFFMACGIVAAD